MALKWVFKNNKINNCAYVRSLGYVVAIVLMLYFGCVTTVSSFSFWLFRASVSRLDSKAVVVINCVH